MSKIQKEDVLQVAKHINVYNLTDEEITSIIDMYPIYEKADKTATWVLIVEKMIYELIN